MNVEHGVLWAGDTTTNPTGNFEIPIPGIGLRFSGGNMWPFEIRITNSTGRTLFRSEAQRLSLIGPDWNLGDIVIPTTTLTGWRITNLDPNGVQRFYSPNNAVTPLMDNEVAWQELETAINVAQSEICFQCFFQDTGLVFLRHTDDPPRFSNGIMLENRLLSASRRVPPVNVRFLIRKAVPGFYPIHTAGKVNDFFAAQQPHPVNLRTHESFVALPLHAKFVTFDNVDAHLIGSPFLSEYFDSAAHRIREPRRGARVFPKNAINVPVHDVGLKLTGPSVGHLRQTFFEFWNDADDPDEGDSAPSPDAPTPNAPVQIARTLPDKPFAAPPFRGETGILEAYQRAFDAAENFIYFENQYVLEPAIFEAMRLALRRARDSNKPLVIIGLINYDVDLFGYVRVQTMRIRAFREALKVDHTDNRLGLFTLIGHENPPPGAPSARQQIIRNYVHTKAAIVDDKWATVGSANLDSVSLIHSDYLPPPLKPQGEGRRATEVNALMFNGVDGVPSSDVPAAFRKALWAKHLGMSASDPSLVGPDGLLALWNAKADEKVASLNANPATIHGCRVIKWQYWPSVGWNTKNLLKDAGVTNLGRFDVLSGFPNFNLETGQWME